MKEAPIGQRFGKLVATRELSKEERNSRHRKIESLCDCGKKTVSFMFSLTTGKTKSCGCVAAQMSKDRWVDPTYEMREKQSIKSKTHGLSKTKAFRCWTDMLERCNNQTHPWYSDYGGRGIKVCDHWTTFINFWNDFGKFCSDGMQIDRVDNNEGYYLGNCRWATRSQQQRNRRDTLIIKTPLGLMDVKTASEIFKVSVSCIKYRISAGYTHEEAVSKKSQRPCKDINDD